MTEAVIESLPEVLKRHICSIKKSSVDIQNHIPMCDSTIKVIDFDKIPKDYSRGRGWPGFPKSNDALYIDSYGKWYFIEFKNGSISKDELFRKIYDSLIMLMEWKIIPDFDFIRKKIRYILVYNSAKYEKVAESMSRDANYNYFMRLAGREKTLFEIDKFEKYLFYETHTYTQSEFEEKFIYPMELEEKENR